MNTQNFDVIVLGGGSAGYACALRTSQLGMKVALVERGRLGGTCLHTGCIPTKALLHAAEVADAVRNAQQFGVVTEPPRIDMDRVHEYKNGVIARLFNGLTGLVTSRGIDVFNGAGELIDPHTVRIDQRELRGRSVVLATGARARSLTGVVPDGLRVVTSDDALTLKHVPSSVIILGGGVIGCEFASIWAAFGAGVRIVDIAPRLLPTEDEDVSRRVQRAFRKRGITLDLGMSPESIATTDSGVCVTLPSGEAVEAEMLLVAVGREPVLDEVALTRAGIKLSRGFVATDSHLRTSQPSVYAIGDVVQGLQLAHRGFQHGIFVAEHLAGLGPKPPEDAAIPRVTYCDPQVASVGLTETRARTLHGNDHVETCIYDLSGNSMSQIHKTTGFVKLVRQSSGPLIGIHIVGPNAGELIGEAQVLLGLNCTPDQVASLSHAHPSVSEALGEAVMLLAGKPFHALH